MPGENLTRAEAAERASIVATQSYEIDLDLTTGPTTFASTTVVRFTATPGASTFIDLVAPSVVLDADGFVEVPAGAGIGVEVVPERLEKYTLRTERLT